MTGMKGTHMEYEIRKMREDEYPLLAEFLYEAVFQREDSALLPKSVIKEPSLKIYIENFGLENDRCLCAEAGGKIVGAVWTRTISGFGSVGADVPEFAISLYKDYRGLGIGTAMMRQMLRLLREEGWKKASLAVQKDNYALKMYLNTGFEIIGENEEEFIMVCNLDSGMEDAAHGCQNC